MAQKRSRDSGNPILNSPHEEPRGIADDDWNIPAETEDEAVHRAFMRAQEGSLRRFWEETKNDKL